MDNQKLHRAIARQAVRIDELEAVIEQNRDDAQEWLAQIQFLSKIVTQVRSQFPDMEVQHLPGAVIKLKEELEEEQKARLSLTKTCQAHFDRIQELEEVVNDQVEQPAQATS